MCGGVERKGRTREGGRRGKEGRKKERRKKKGKEGALAGRMHLPLVVFGEADRPVVLAQDDKAPEDDCSDIDVARLL